LLGLGEVSGNSAPAEQGKRAAQIIVIVAKADLGRKIVMKYNTAALATVGSVLALCGPLPALAQAAAKDGGPASPSATANGNAAQPDIIVTATKRSESVQRVPLTVSVVSQSTIQNLNIANTADLTRAVPGLTYTSSVSVALAVFDIRGIGTYATGGGVEQSVGVAVDGVPLGRPSGSIADLVDVANVEVLKGPQGMLFGKNATAGLINVITQRPKLGVNEFIEHASFSSRNNLQLSTTANLSLAPNLAMRGTVWSYRRDGVVDQFQTGRDLSNKNSRGARLKLLWDATDRLSFNLTGEWTSHSDNGVGVTIRNFVPANYTAANGGAVIEAYENRVGTIAGPDNRRVSSTVAPSDRDHVNAYTGQFDYRLGGATLTGIISHRETGNGLVQEPTGSGAPLLGNQTFGDDIRYRQTTAELRVTSSGDQAIRYTLGAFYFDLGYDDVFLFNTVGTVPVPVHTITNASFKNRNYAGFGELDIDLTSRFHVLAGLRLSHDDTSGTLDRQYSATPPVVIPSFNGPGASFGPITGNTSTSYTNLSGRGGIRYDIAKDVMAYATYSRGYKGPGVTYGATSTAAQLAVTNGLVAPETVEAEEIGIKSRFFDRRLTINMAFYNQVYSNFQASTRLPTVAAIFAITSAKQLRSTGVDVDFSAVVTQHLTVSGAMQYNNARYTDFENAACYPGQTVALGCVNGNQSLDGHPLQNAPKWAGNITARYEHGLSAQLVGAAEINYSYRSKVVYNTVADPNEQQGGYGLLNVNFNIKKNDGAFSVRLFVNNLLDKNFVGRVAVQNGGSYYVNYPSYEAQRIFGIAFDAKF
jgi:iron complex outermembrane receptor protein